MKKPDIDNAVNSMTALKSVVAFTIFIVTTTVSVIVYFQKSKEEIKTIVQEAVKPLIVQDSIQTASLEDLTKAFNDKKTLDDITRKRQAYTDSLIISRMNNPELLQEIKQANTLWSMVMDELKKKDPLTQLMVK